MPANWPTFITNVTDFIVDEVASGAATDEAGAEQFGEFVANEYFSAIGPATSIYGQSHGGTGSLGPLVSVYKEQFRRLLGEDTTNDGARDTQPDIPNSNTIDNNGNEVPFSGKKSDPSNPSVKTPAEPDPEYADPDMNEVVEPIIDPEELTIFLNEYSDTYDLYRYKYFEFTLDGSETKDEVANIISNRILFSFLLEENGSKRQDMLKWISSFQNWDTDTISSTVNFKRELFKDLVYESMDNNGYDAEYIIGKVKYRTNERLKESYAANIVDGVTLEIAVRDGIPSEMKYNIGTKNFRPTVVQEVFNLEQNETNEDYEVSPIITKEFITFFTGSSGQVDASHWDAAIVKTKYTDREVKNKWGEIIVPDTVQDVVDKKNKAAPYMLTRQRTVDALAEIENGDAGEDPYELLAEATIDYWKSTEKQPLSANPPAVPCLSSQPLGGKYIQVYTGNKKKLAEGIRKALNAGKDSKNKREAGQKVAKALSLAYTRHLVSLKFIYLGGIPVPLVPYIPMIGFVPNVF